MTDATGREGTPQGDGSGMNGSNRPKRTGASLTELELAFAQDPQSTAYMPLCEAYLEQGRFMEAMVVCKKGLKAHPTSVEAKVLLANVYAKQQKYARALQEMDEVVNAHGTSGLAFLGRGKIRLDSGDEKGGVADLKKAVDLDPALEEAGELLKKRGIVYPEPVAPPPPPPAAAMPQQRMPSMAMPQPGMGMSYPQPSGLPQRAGSAIGMTAPTPAELEGAGPTWPPEQAPGGVPPRGESGIMPGMPLPRGGSGIMPGYAPMRPRLEGEEELEAIANQVASDSQEKGGSPKTFLALLVGGFLSVVVIGGIMFNNKRVTEGISDLTKSARYSFAQDTYGAYKKAAADYEKILDAYDSDHPQTLGSLAHTYAILWGEHGDTDRKQALEKLITAAQKKAPDVSHTAAAVGLTVLYGTDDRHKAAQSAYDAAWPMVKKQREENNGAIGTYADLTLGIIDVELGNYKTGHDTLGQVVAAMPSSVRAKVWYARASHRAGHLDKAESAFSEALRVAKDHPGALAGRALVRVQRGRLESGAADLVRFDEFALKFPKEVSAKDTALAEYARSEVFRAAGDEGRATAAYERAVRLDKNNADFPYGLGRSLLSQGRAKEALEPLRKALQMEPNRRAFLIALARAETETGDFASAKQHIDAALKEDPRDLRAALGRAALLRTQRSPETEPYLREVLEWSKDAPEANLELGRYYRTTGKTSEAKQLLEKAVNGMDSLPPTLRGEVVLEYGKLNAELGDDTTAYNSFKQAGEFGAMEGWFRAAQVLVRGGRRDRDALKDACSRYLNAGALPYTNEARDLCAGS